MRYLVLGADYSRPALRDEYARDLSPEVLGVSEHLVRRIREWNDRYREIIPLGPAVREAEAPAGLIAVLDEEGLALVAAIRAELPDAKVRYFSEGQLRYVHSPLGDSISVHSGDPLETPVLVELVVSALRELADEELQRRRWTPGQGPEVGSIIEATSQLLDDSGLGDALDSGAEVLGGPADSALAELAAELLQIDGTRAPSLILADPRLEEVRTLAARALELVSAGEDFALLRQRRLGDAGRRRVRDCVAAGLTLGRLLAEQLDFERGVATTFAPPGASDARLLQWDEGGLLRAPVGWQRLVDHLGLWLGRRDRVLVAENVLARPPDPVLRHASGSRFFVADEVYEYLVAGSAEGSIEATLRRADAGYSLNAVVTSVERGPQAIEDVGFLHQLVSRVEVVVTRAYDGEGFVVWDRS